MLASCSYEPSEEVVKIQVEQLLRKNLSDVGNKKVLGVELGAVLGIGDLKINEIQKISCLPEKGKSTICEVFVDYEYLNNGGVIELLGGFPATRKTVNFRFVKISGEWRVIDSPSE